MPFPSQSLYPPFYPGSTDPVITGSWWGLLNIYREAEQLKLDSDTRRPVACPRDGTALDAGVNGILHCALCGWLDDGSTPAEWIN